MTCPRDRAFKRVTIPSSGFSDAFSFNILLGAEFCQHITLTLFQVIRQMTPLVITPPLYITVAYQLIIIGITIQRVAMWEEGSDTCSNKKPYKLPNSVFLEEKS